MSWPKKKKMKGLLGQKARNLDHNRSIQGGREMKTQVPTQIHWGMLWFCREVEGAIENLCVCVCVGERTKDEKQNNKKKVGRNHVNEQQ